MPGRRPDIEKFEAGEGARRRSGREGEGGVGGGGGGDGGGGDADEAVEAHARGAEGERESETNDMAFVDKILFVNEEQLSMLVMLTSALQRRRGSNTTRRSWCLERGIKVEHCLFSVFVAVKHSSCWSSCPLNS